MWTASRTKDRQRSTRSSRYRCCDPASVAFCHHDPLFPGVPGVDIGPAAAAVRDLTSGADYFELEYATERRLST